MLKYRPDNISPRLKLVVQHFYIGYVIANDIATLFPCKHILRVIALALCYPILEKEKFATERELEDKI